MVASTQGWQRVLSVLAAKEAAWISRSPALSIFPGSEATRRRARPWSAFGLCGPDCRAKLAFILADDLAPPPIPSAIGGRADRGFGELFQYKINGFAADIWGRVIYPS